MGDEMIRGMPKTHKGCQQEEKQEKHREVEEPEAVLQNGLGAEHKGSGYQKERWCLHLDLCKLRQEIVFGSKAIIHIFDLIIQVEAL